MRLSKTIAPGLNGAVHSSPHEHIFSLPEKVLQFGTGVLLRGLPDYYIDKANKQGLFNGRVVVVKSTTHGDADAFELQDGLYTHCIRGINNHQVVEENIINASVSRVLSAHNQWAQVLECAANPDMQIIISNTTEAGLSLNENDNVQAAPPVSFPAKLLAFLYRRYTVFNGDATKGMVILPTELVIDNGSVLKELVLQLAKQQIDNAGFIEWLQQANHFCNTLVDRIVPGRLNTTQQLAMEGMLGYHDDLTIMSEAYNLWAIETGSEAVKEVLSFAAADPGMVITDEIQKHRELKLRLLNATHTFSCALAILAGFDTVKEAMDNQTMSLFIYDLMVHETAPCITGDNIPVLEAHEFANQVLDRFRNPFIHHQWQSITLQYTQKMKMRNIPLLVEYDRRKMELPVYMALGFAAYLLLMKCTGHNGQFTGEWKGRKYPVQDDQAAYFEKLWQQHEVPRLVTTVLGDENLWGANLLRLPGFAAAVTANMEALQRQDVLAVIQQQQHNSSHVESHDA